MHKMCNALNKLATAEDSRQAKSMFSSAILITGMKLLQSANVSLRVNGLAALNQLLAIKADDDLPRKLAEQRLVETIFCENSHEEVISRAKDVLAQMVYQNVFLAEHVGCVWACCVDKNEDISRAALGTLTGLLDSFPESVCRADFTLCE